MVKKAPAPEPKVTVKTVGKKAPDTKKEDNKKYVTTKHLASQLGVKPATLRRYLRTQPAYQDGKYTRYKWDPEDSKDAKFLTTVKDGFSKFQTAEKEKNRKRLAELKSKDKTTAKGKKSKKVKEEEEEPEEEEEEPEEEAETEEEEESSDEEEESGEEEEEEEVIE